MRSMRFAPAALVTCLLCASAASAQTRADSEAKALFAAGREAFDSGRYEAALDRWQEAYDLSHRPALNYNIGLAHDRLRHDEQALAAFKTYLAQVPAADNREEVESRIRALERAKAERDAASAPTPVQTAQAAVAVEPQRDAGLTNSDSNEKASKPITKQWWFWTGIGVVVVGGIVTAVAVASGGDTQAVPVQSNSGVTVMAVTSR